MALAKLCADVGNHRLQPRFYAFVVDHGARPGSKDEAEITRLRLRSLGAFLNSYTPTTFVF